MGLIAGGALLAGCGQVQLVFRGNPARFYFGDNLIGGLIDLLLMLFSFVE